MHTTRVTRAAAAATLTLTLALTAACGGEEPAGDASGASAPESRHNQADVGFAQDMLVHHAQALDMVELTDGRPLEPDVRRLASDIEAAQAPEIETFTDWLETWDERVPHAGMDGMDGMQGMEGTDDMEGMDHDMPGMMTSGQMDRLTEASDEEFQSAWLELMIEHHEGAVEMAETQVERGEYAPAIELAEQIAASQTSEIEEMRRMLAG